MIKNILAVAVIATLSACSSSSNDSADDSPAPDNNPPANDAAPPVTVTPPTTTTPPGSISPPGDGAGPEAGTKAGSYIGTFGFAGDAVGVYVIDNENQLAGLAIAADGSAQSLFGDLGGSDMFEGSLRQYLHDESQLNDAALSFGSTGGVANPLGIDVTIVNGQTIESNAESSTSVALMASSGSLAPANAQSLAGTWSGIFSFCTLSGEPPAPVPGECNLLTTQLTFSGSSMTGSTTFQSFEGGEPFVAPMFGAITDFGDVALFDFAWNNIGGYSGLVTFTPDGSGDIAFVGENLGNPDNITISGRLARQ